MRELDWKTPMKSIDVGRHWRIWLGVLIFASLSTATWHALYPNTLWFDKLWAGLTTGSALGAFAGGCWQVRDKARRGLTSGKFLLVAVFGWGAFGVVSVGCLAPQMRAEETARSEIRSQTPQNVVSIQVECGASRVILADKADVEQFCEAASHAELFYPSHEGSIRECELTVFLREGQTQSFRARVPERHRDDLSLVVKGPSNVFEIRVPGGGKWIRSAMARVKESQQPAPQVQW